MASWDAILRATMLGAIPVCQLVGLLDIWLFVVLLALSSWMRSWGNAGRFTLMAAILPQEQHLPANALIGILSEFAALIGPGIAAVVISIGGAPLAIAADAATFAVLALTYLLAVPRTARLEPNEPSGKRATGFATTFRNPLLLGLLILGFTFYLLYGPVRVALPIFTAETGDGSATTLAAFWTAFGIGAVIGGLGAGHLQRWPIQLTTIATVIGWGLALLPLGLGFPTVVALVSFGLGGLTWAPFPSTSMALLQRSTTELNRPQVLAANSTMLNLSIPLGTLVGGPLVSTIGAKHTIAASAILTVALGVATIVFLRVRRNGGAAAAMAGRSRGRPWPVSGLIRAIR